MTIEKTIQTLSILAETILDDFKAPKEDMSEVHLIAVSEDDYWALENAVNMLRGLKIIIGIFKGKEGQE